MRGERIQCDRINFGLDTLLLQQRRQKVGISYRQGVDDGIYFDGFCFQSQVSREGGWQRSDWVLRDYVSGCVERVFLGYREFFFFQLWGQYLLMLVRQSVVVVIGIFLLGWWYEIKICGDSIVIQEILEGGDRGRVVDSSLVV